MKIKNLIALLFLLPLSAALSLRAQNEGDQVVVVYNTREPESKGVALHYAAMRHVPANQVLGLDMPDREVIKRVEFQKFLQIPLSKTLEARGLIHSQTEVVPATATKPKHNKREITQASIRYIVLCYGVPLTIENDSSVHEDGLEKMDPQLRKNTAAVDSELACLALLNNGMRLSGFMVNPFFNRTNAQYFNPTNQIFMVARLDGPSASVANHLVDKAMEAETNGLWGRAYFDWRNLPPLDPYRAGDDWIKHASEAARSFGYETVVDTNKETFPAEFPLSQVAFYAGWYDATVSGPFARPKVEFMPGAFAYHLHSYSAQTLRTTTEHWVGPLLDRGATATMGCVDEPFLGGTPNIGVFFDRFLLSKFSFGEAAYACQQCLSWETTVVGDPLYRPFRRNPPEVLADLEQHHRDLVGWFYLRLANMRILRGESIEVLAPELQQQPAVRDSSVLQEKLANLYFAAGKPASSIHALQEALKLNTTPQQRIRITLNLADQLERQGKNAEALGVYEGFLQLNSDYPDKASIYRSLAVLCDTLGRKTEAENYRRKLPEPAAP